MFRATGPGKVDVILDNGVGIMTALLYNFDFDDFEGRKQRPLKAEHIAFLDERVVPLLENDQGAIWLEGAASKIGTNSWNMETSMVRAGRVQAHLANRGISHDQIQPDAVGEELTGNHVQDDERDRAVRLWVLPKFHPGPPARKVPKPKISRQFKIAMITGLSANQAATISKFLKGKLSRGIGIDGLFFIVWDPVNNLSCLYFYLGIGLGLGLSFTPKVSATTHGPWNSFTTEKPIGVWQFGRWSRFTSAGAFDYSVNWITIETPRGVDNVDSLKIDTGRTLGGGLSSTVGDFIRVEGPTPFTGP